MSVLTPAHTPALCHFGLAWAARSGLDSSRGLPTQGGALGCGVVRTFGAGNQRPAKAPTARPTWQPRATPWVKTRPSFQPC